MNVCNERHNQIYKVTYKGAKNSEYSPEWLVCEKCLEHKFCFSNDEQIIEIQLIN